MEQSHLGFHETMDLHEMINFKTICLMKSKLMQGICFDNDLKALMEKDVKQSQAALTELKELYSKAATKYGGGGLTQ
jgi:similar to spore coat protein